MAKGRVEEIKIKYVYGVVCLSESGSYKTT